MRKNKPIEEVLTEKEKQQEANEFPSWKKKTFLFLSGQTISLFGSSLVQFAIIWYITLTTQSGAMMTISTVCGFAPQVLISIFSGVWADRYNRKKLIIGADALVAISTLILALFFFSGHNNFIMIFLVSAIRSVGTGIQTPAVNALLPQIVPPARLTRIGGINNSLMSIMFLLSPAVGGAILSFASFEYTLLIDVGTAAIAIAIMVVLKVPLHKKAMQKQTTGYFDDLKAGIKYAASTKFFRAYFIFMAAFFFMVVPAAQLTPLMVTRVFGAEVWRLSLVEVMFSIGSVVGGIAISAWGGFANRTRTIALACVCFGVLTALLGFMTGFIGFLIVTCITGLSMPLFSTPAMVLLQEQVPQDMQGRIFGLMQIVMTTALPVGMLFFGPLADVVKIQYLFIITGIVMALLGIAVFRNKHFKHGLITE
ncbi:MAG: MFS transporter [Christensenellaceae bacterium]